MHLFTMSRISAFFMHAFVLNAEILGDHGIMVRGAICLVLLRFKMKLNGKIIEYHVFSPTEKLTETELLLSFKSLIFEFEYFLKFDFF